jgi:formate C-acetyltransferase
VKPIREKDGLITDFEVEGDYPKFGNNDDRADSIAAGIVKLFADKLKNSGRIGTASLPFLF